MCLRRFYRNCVRAEAYHAAPNGVYRTFTSDELDAFISDEDRTEALESRKEEALNILADMSFMIEQMKADVRVILPQCDELFSAGSTAISKRETSLKIGSSASQQLQALLNSCIEKLQQRINSELPTLPYKQLKDAKDALASTVADLTRDGEAPRLMTYSARLRKTPGQFFTGNVQPAMRRATTVVADKGIREAVRVSSSYVSGLWARLNGLGGSAADSLPFGMQLPASCAGDVSREIDELGVRIDKLEKKLVEVSKAREQRLRNASIELRAVMAYEMQDMDQEVMNVGRELALCTLEVQVEYVYVALEDEALQILDVEPSGAGEERGDGYAARLQRLAPRRGSTQELSILVAEYALLCGRLAALWDAFRARENLPALMPTFDEELKRLAFEIPDMRMRLGIPDQDVFSSSGFSLRKLQLALKESLVKVNDGADFFVLGVKMLGSDLAYSARLFGRASLGNTLKPREVSALRRTLVDILTFIPFTIILIIPLTPLGHVLVFGFIQRYFPNFFPSQFNTKRQDLVKRHDELRQQLARAQEAANNAEDEQELEQAMAAVARLNPPGLPMLGDDNSIRLPGQDRSMAGSTPGQAGKTSAKDALDDLKKKVEEAKVSAMTYNSDEDGDSGMQH